jgi:hypothetical protein
MPKITGNDILKIALANPDCGVPPEALDAAKVGKRNKYNAVRVQAFDGMKFDSKAEMAAYGEYRLREMVGEISDLKHHPVLELTAGVKYEADFIFTENGRTVIVDVKGGKATATPLFKVKWKQAQALYPDYEFRLVEK